MHQDKEYRLIEFIERFLLLLVVILFISNILWLAYWLKENKLFSNLQNNVSIVPPVRAQPAAVLESQNNPDISAKSAVSIEFNSDLEGKILFAKNDNDRLPIASLTKLMTALIVIENYNLDKQIVISKDAMAQVGVQGVLKEGQVLSVKNLLYITLIESSNRAAYALSSQIGESNFVALMNKKADEIGLYDTHFEDSTGLSGNSYSTADDLAKLSGYIFFNYPLFGKIVGLKDYNLYLSDGSLHHMLQNTNELLGKNGIVGGKTGYTEEAKGCFMAIQQKADKYLIYVILGADDRFSEMEKLIQKVANLEYQVSIK